MSAKASLGHITASLELSIIKREEAGAFVQGNSVTRRKDNEEGFFTKGSMMKKTICYIHKLRKTYYCKLVYTYIVIAKFCKTKLIF